ncbi:MAG TPA: putative porin [Puia sp.]|nr:putative porin [Puia sp.]
MGSLLGISFHVHAQNPLSRFQGMGGGRSAGPGDTLQHRKADTITINFRYLDSSRLQRLDSSIRDFSKKVPQPPTYINLGNIGTPSRDLVFTPRMRSGWDPGWHAWDLYVFSVDDVKFYNTTKPYSEMGYLLGSKTENLISILHTQNIGPNLNFAFDYRLINSPGTFQNQNSNHNNYRFSVWQRSKNKRYQAFFALVASKLQTSENGGIRDSRDLNSIAYTDRATLPVRLGNNLVQSIGNPFSSNVSTGTRYTTGTFLLRQQYDLGQKDSVVTDSSVIPLFYPRLRMEHTISYTTYHYRFLDRTFPPDYTLDSTYYANNYHLDYISPLDTFFREVRWRDVTNDFSLYQFPDSKNPQQFFKAGASFQILTGVYDTSLLTNGSLTNVTHKMNDHNLFLHGEYRNRTRNLKWDIEAFGKIYLSGLNTGDYNASISLKRLLSRKIGFLELGFQNTNRSPSTSFDPNNSLYYDTAKSFSKENITNIFATIERPQSHLRLKGSYYLISNYAYVSNYFREQQQSTLFNLLQVSLQKEFILHGPWKWRTLVVMQQVAGFSPVHVPLIVTHNQIGYDGNLGFKSLNISFGLELRYFTEYKADGYSPLTGQFYTQGDTTVRQHLPDITGYLNFRIKTFTAYIRTENLNTMQFGGTGFGFNNNNFVAPSYPSPGLLIRIGIFWGFIN